MIKFLSYTAVVVIAATLVAWTAGYNHIPPGSNTLTAAEKKQGWILLFDGKTTNGWHTYGKDKAEAPWRVENGALTLTEGSKEGGDLVTNEAFTNYHLQLDWKISEKGNSGIIFNVHEDPAQYKNTFETGPEMQVLDNGTPVRLGHPDAKLYTHRAGDLYDLLAAKEAAKPLGEWNTAEIVLKNGKLDFYLNGQHTLSTTMWDNNWKQMVAISKFKSMPGFGTYKTGKIALQNHGGDQVWFRNIKIMKL